LFSHFSFSPKKNFPTLVKPAHFAWFRMILRNLYPLEYRDIFYFLRINIDFISLHLPFNLFNHFLQKSYCNELIVKDFSYSQKKGIDIAVYGIKL